MISHVSFLSYPKLKAEIILKQFKPYFHVKLPKWSNELCNILQQSYPILPIRRILHLLVKNSFPCFPILSDTVHVVAWLFMIAWSLAIRCFDKYQMWVKKKMTNSKSIWQRRTTKILFTFPLHLMAKKSHLFTTEKIACVQIILTS